MPIDSPISDIGRSIQHDPSMNWPESVIIEICWRDKDGRTSVLTEIIFADQFFGHGKYGAPMEGAHLIAMIERMRRLGPPKVARGPKPKDLPSQSTTRKPRR